MLKMMMMKLPGQQEQRPFLLRILGYHLLLCLFLTVPATRVQAIEQKGATEVKPPPCPHVKDYTAEYHLDSACNKPEQNRFMDSLDRGGQQRWLQENGIYHVPDKQTHACPVQIDDLFHHDNSDPIYHNGYSTLWIVHNKATSPVVISWVDRNQKVDGHPNNYQEVSATDSTISPPHHDPNTILQPNEWKSVSTFDGHVFHIRRLEADGSLGPVLVQHRVGLIPITNVFGHAIENYCDPNDPDIEPVIVVEDHVERAPEFRRSLRPPLRPCNTQDIGFRNLVGCPLNVYYAGLANITGVPRAPGQDCSFTPKSCHEQFKFHLGKNPYAADFMWGWDSQTKFEGTYVGHNFVFRLMAHDDIVVDSVTVEPTYIYDCPDLKVNENDGFLDSLSPQLTAPLKPPAKQIHDQLLRTANHKRKEDDREGTVATATAGSSTTQQKHHHDHNDYDDEEF